MMYDTSKKVRINIDGDLYFVLNPADGQSADPKNYDCYFINFFNEKNGANETLKFFVSKKLYLIMCDLDYWNTFIKKLAHRGYKPLHFYFCGFNKGEDYMYLTMECYYEIS